LVWNGRICQVQIKSCSPVFGCEVFITFGITEKADFPWDSDSPEMFPQAWFLKKFDKPIEDKISNIIDQVF